MKRYLENVANTTAAMSKPLHDPPDHTPIGNDSNDKNKKQSSHDPDYNSFLSNLTADSQICAQVLQHLATGTTPTHLLPSTPINATDDAKTYQEKTNKEHHHLLTVALSILLDSTSPGPDPLALQSLGWA
jgi:hypothetical protein